jgi:hypothetical protein
MADVTQVPADVRLVGESQYEERIQFGEAIVPGDWLYQHSTTKKHLKAQNDGTAFEAGTRGMSLGYGGDGDYGYLAKPGAEVDVGAVLVQGTLYSASNAAGKMAPIADVSTGRYITTYGVGLANGNLIITIDASGVTKA